MIKSDKKRVEFLLSWELYEELKEYAKKNCRKNCSQALEEAVVALVRKIKPSEG